MADVKTQDTKLNEMILAGKALEAFDEFYADDVVMQENEDEPRVGKPTCRHAEVQFFSSIETFHGAKLLGSAVGDDLSYSEWAWDVTFKGGVRRKSTQVAARRWKNGKIVHERFYYKG